MLTCFDAKTGQIHYTDRLGATQGYTASPVSDGRHLYFAGENGKMVVVPATEKFSITATNNLRDIFMATPAISDGLLLIRTKTKLIAVGALDSGKSVVP